MKSLDEFMAFLLPSLPGCPLPLAEQALRLSAIEFATRSEVVQEISTQPAKAGVAVYDVDVPNQQRLVNVLQVLMDGRPLDGVSYPVPSDLPPGRPLWVMKPLPNQADVTLLPTPHADGVLTVQACFKPVADASQFADELFDDWHDAVVQGALRRLCAMPAQPFTAASTVVAAAAAFEAAVVEARLVARKKRLVSHQRVRPCPLA